MILILFVSKLMLLRSLSLGYKALKCLIMFCPTLELSKIATCSGLLIKEKLNSRLLALLLSSLIKLLTFSRLPAILKHAVKFFWGETFFADEGLSYVNEWWISLYFFSSTGKIFLIKYLFNYLIWGFSTSEFFWFQVKGSIESPQISYLLPLESKFLFPEI